jgi:hypothetical protein
VKVRIEFTVDVDDHVRRRINEFYGREGLATRQEVKDWYRDYGRSMDLDLSAEWNEGEARSA